MTTRILTVIPARGGSKGLPGKNIRDLGGMPLLAHSIACARLSGSAGRIVVSTDSEEIARVALAHGAEVPFMRPADLASDTAAMWPVVQHALSATEEATGERYDAVLLLDPTSPGRLPEDITAAVATLGADEACDGVVGVSEPDFSPYWHCVVEADGYMQDLIPGADKYVRRQELPTVYRINATLYVWRAAFVRSAANWRTGTMRLHVVPEERALHIDTAAQFRHVEYMLQAGEVAFPWL